MCTGLVDGLLITLNAVHLALAPSVWEVGGLLVTLSARHILPLPLKTTIRPPITLYPANQQGGHVAVTQPGTLFLPHATAVLVTGHRWCSAPAWRRKVALHMLGGGPTSAPPIPPGTNNPHAYAC